MQPTTVDGDTTYVWGKLHYLEFPDNNIRLADSEERGVLRPDAVWNDKAFVCDHGRVILDIHEWEDDDTDYDSNPDLYGAVYYNILVLEGSTYVDFDGGIFQYGKDSTLWDFLWYALDQVLRASYYLDDRGAVA